MRRIKKKYQGFAKLIEYTYWDFPIFHFPDIYKGLKDTVIGESRTIVKTMIPYHFQKRIQDTTNEGFLIKMDG